ncbi:MAG: ABC transporter permease [Planctomycetes bacterium]|nr:ABC transporter permease [Planctomycetota bacterium]
MTTSRPSSTTWSPELAPRRGFFDGIAVTIRVAGLSLLRGRRGVVLALLCALPLIWPALELFHSGLGTKGGVGFVQLLTELWFPRINLIVALFVGCGALGEEIDGKTVPYLLTRPVPRSALLIGRWLVAAVTASVLLGAGYLALYVATVAPMGGDALLVDLPILGYALLGMALSMLAYCAVFMLFAVTIKWPLLVGLVLLFVWEEFAATMPGNLARYTLLHHVYTLLAHGSGDEAYHLLARPEEIELLPAAESLQVLAGVTAGSLALALAKFRRKSYLV